MEFVSVSITFFVLMLCLYFIVKMEAKTICILYLNGVHRGKVKEYKRKKLWGAYIIWWISGIMLMLVYVDILTDFIEIISCGENNLLIILITTLFYFCSLTLMGWAEVMEADIIYYYNKGINLIRLHYELPDCIFPYKHDGTQSVEDVVDEVVSSEDLGIEDYPCEGAMKHWK